MGYGYSIPPDSSGHTEVGMKKPTYCTLVLLLTSLIMVCSSLVVLGAVNSIKVPDEGPYLHQGDIYHHLLEDDDMLVVGRYQASYDTVPDNSIARTFLGRFLVGGVDLARVSPYSYHNSGYGYGGFSMYLSADEAPTWSSNCTIEFTGSPTLQWLGATATEAMDGAVAADGGVQTVETTASNSAAANDMTLLPAVPVVNDAYYFGSNYTYSILTLNIGQQGVGTWTVTWEYYDGDGWSTIPSVVDDTSGFKATVGNHDVSFAPPSDWSITTIQSISAYWIRGRVSAYTAITTQPKGTQAWVNGGIETPKASTTSPNWRNTASSAATQALLYAHIIGYAEELGDYWNLALTTSTPSGVVLSSYGEAYFTNMIPQLQSMCPNLFSAGVETVFVEDRDQDMSAANATMAWWPFDWSGASGWLGLPSSNDEVFRTLIGFALAFMLFALMIGRSIQMPLAMIAGYGLLFIMAVVGWVNPAILGGFTFLAVLGVGIVFVWSKVTA